MKESIIKDKKRITPLQEESLELVRILTAIVKTGQGN
jgi:hypothetical protein